MKFNESKFVNMKYENNKVHRVQNYLAFDKVINNENSCRDLGVIMSNDLTFDIHINSTVIKSKWVLRTFQTRNKLLIFTLYKSFVLLLLEYNSQIWNPIKIKKH